MAAQRIRVWFRKGERLRYISHLDVLRSWERSIRRAGLPLSYSQGFTPHPKLAFAGPLPLGFTSEGEIMDVTLDERVEVDDFIARVEPQTTPDLALVRAREVPLSDPAPQAAVRFADYTLAIPLAVAEASEAIARFMALGTFEWTEEKREKARTYDLRATVVSLQATPAEGCSSLLSMRLRAGPEMTGRPEQVVAALFPGIEPVNITRTNIVLEESSPSREAWMRVGRFQ